MTGPEPVSSAPSPTGRRAGLARRSGVRSMEPDDLPRVAALLDHLQPAAFGGAVADRVAPLRRLLFDHPWYEPTMPPLVYEHEGGVAGFVGSHPRPLIFDGKRLHAVWTGPMVSDPDARVPVGPMLLRTLLAGPQDATLTDGANLVARQLWERLGGRVSHVRCLSWWRMLRPWRGAQELWGLQRGSDRRPGRSLLQGLDALSGRVAGFRAPDPAGTTTAPLDPSTFVALRESARSTDPHVGYDAASAAWLLDELGRPGGGRGLARRLVVAEGGEPAGWYVADLPPRGLGRLLGMGARPGASAPTFARVLRDAWDLGVPMVTGRLEPRLLEALTGGRRPLLSRATRVLVHADDRRLADALVAGEGDLTRLDGEWWMLPHLKRLTVPDAAR